MRFAIALGVLFGALSALVWWFVPGLLADGGARRPRLVVAALFGAFMGI